jgi:hypothetical protein
MGEIKIFTCQNASCKKNFTTPLKTLNLQQNPTEPYFSCPYCLSKIETIDEPLKIVEEPLEAQEKPSNVEIEKSSNNDRTSDCRFHIGYLSERSSKENIPDDCLICKDIVNCMMKKMRE